jgi:hypothetical protein
MSTEGPNTATNRDRYDDTGGGWLWLWFWLFLILIVFGGWGWAGWWGGWGGPMGWWPRREIVVVPENVQRQAMPAGTTASGEFIGRTIQNLSGKVAHVYGPGEFTLAPSEGGRPLLVVSKDAKAPAVKEGETVRVSGTVEKFDTTTLRKQTGVDLGKIPDKEFTGRPALLASSISTQAAPG